jgi:Na+-transporting methylmalonyl-CoA/oxaloacetate decarboxylase gamma subunit
MSIREVADTLNISLSDFKQEFLPLDSDPNVDNRTLRSLNIPLDDVYQYYSTLKYGFNDNARLADVSAILEIPFAKMVGYLNLDPRNKALRDMTIRDLSRETLDFYILKEKFEGEKYEFSSYLTVMGMSVVFIALIITSLVITQIVSFARKTVETKPAVKTIVGKIMTNKIENLQCNAIIAVIAAIHKHRMDTVTEHKIMLTYRRANVNMWHASGKVDLPTIKYNTLRRR